MDKLLMIKAIAKLESAEVEFDDVLGCGWFKVNYEIYNPITNSHLNRKLILKYKVRLIKYHRSVTITQENGGFGLKCIRATYRTDDDLPYAVVECILKANGLWVTNNK